MAIVTDALAESGKAMAQAWGLPNYKFLTVPHPIANLTEEEINQRARAISSKVVQLFLEGQR